MKYDEFSFIWSRMKVVSTILQIPKWGWDLRWVVRMWFTPSWVRPPFSLQRLRNVRMACRSSCLQACLGSSGKSSGNSWVAHEASQKGPSCPSWSCVTWWSCASSQGPSWADRAAPYPQGDSVTPSWLLCIHSCSVALQSSNGLSEHLY